MTLRELCEQTTRAYDSNAISLKDVNKILDTKIVPRKLVEDILEEMAEDSKLIEDDTYFPINDFDEGYLCALKDYRTVILKLLNDFEEEE